MPEGARFGTRRAAIMSAMGPPFSAGLRSLKQEIAASPLRTEGFIPPWLRGTLVRVGPGEFEAGAQPLRHWFDGFSLLHAFTFRGGEVVYENRFLRTRAREAARQGGAVRFREFATDPCRSLFSRVFSLFSPRLTDNANVNVARLGEHFVAMTETPLPVEFDPRTLETVGVVESWRTPGQVATAHPLVDHKRGVMLSYGIQYGVSSAYRVYEMPLVGGNRRLVGSVDARQPAYMHSFGLTERYVVLVECPHLVNPPRLLLSGRPFIENFRWRPERGTRFLLIHRADGRLAHVVEADAFFAFHLVNAFEQRGRVVVDVCAYPDPSVIDAFYLDRLRTKGFTLPGAGELRRYVIPLRGGRPEIEILCDESMDLPRIHDEWSSAHPYGVVYGVSVRKDRPPDFPNQLVRVDVRRGVALSWAEDGCYPSEAVFVGAPGGQTEDAGVVLSVVLDARRQRSLLLVLDAATFREVGRASVPHVLPFTFHGQYFEGV